MSRSKLTTGNGSAKRSSVSSVVSNGRTSKLRTELRRVMSDRVMKITRCSQQQTNIKKDNLLVKTIDSKSMDKTECMNKETSPKFLAKMTANMPINLSPKSVANHIQLQPIKTFDLKDEQSLVDHIVGLYNDLVKSNGIGSIILAVQSIVNSITHYIAVNELEVRTMVDRMLKDHLLKSGIELRQKYADDLGSEKLRVEGQVQVMLQIENYIFGNVRDGKVRVDDDWVWDIANSIRWLKQTFKDFKIERFLFGEIYANYSLNAPEFISSLMEELGYDKEDNNASESSSEDESVHSPTIPLNTSDSTGNKLKIISSSSKFLSQLSQTACNEDTNSNFSLMGGVNSLFEDDEEVSTDVGFDGQNDEESCSQQYFGGGDREKVDILDEFIKKKSTNNKGSSFVQSSMRSIVIQKKRTRLKIRSPFKSPTKSMTSSKQSRRSPRIKDKQIILPGDEKKRPRSYLITDTPDHKQNSTIITTRQEKLRKRFSFQISNASASSPSVILPSVPDTPVKSANEPVETTITTTGSLFPFQKMYPSPSKSFMSPQKGYAFASPQKCYITPQKIIPGSPLKVYATPSPKRSNFPSQSPLASVPASPLRKSPVQRVIFR